MKRVYIRILMVLAVSGLAACAQYADMAEPADVEPIAKELDDACNRTASGVDDGIGGTGCKIE